MTIDTSEGIWDRFRKCSLRNFGQPATAERSRVSEWERETVGRGSHSERR